MSKTRPRRRRPQGAAARPATAPLIDLDRYVPALITFIANKLSSSATALYQRNFGVNVTEWRIMSLLAIEPGIPASRICHVIGFDKGPVSRTLSRAAEARPGRDPHRTRRRPHPFDLADPEGARDPRQVSSAALERERRLLSCLKKGRAGSPDRPAAALHEISAP